MLRTEIARNLTSDVIMLEYVVAGDYILNASLCCLSQFDHLGGSLAGNPYEYN